MPEETCKGLIYRCQVNQFLNAKGTYIDSIRMEPLKRMSCPGCDRCAYLRDQTREHISMGTPPIINNPVSSALYELRITNLSRDYETGYPDDWDMVFVKIKEARECPKKP